MPPYHDLLFVYYLWAVQCLVCMTPSTDKKENKIFFYFQKGSVAKSYMTNASSHVVKYLRISSYIRKPFLIYDYTTTSLLEFLYIYFLFLFYQWASWPSPASPTARPVFRMYSILILTSVFPRALAAMRRSLHSSGLCTSRPQCILTPFSFSIPALRPVFQDVFFFSPMYFPELWPQCDAASTLRAVSSPASAYAVHPLAPVYSPPPPVRPAFQDVQYSFSHLCISQSLAAMRCSLHSSGLCPPRPQCIVYTYTL